MKMSKLYKAFLGLLTFRNVRFVLAFTSAMVIGKLFGAVGTSWLRVTCLVWAPVLILFGAVLFQLLAAGVLFIFLHD